MARKQTLADKVSRIPGLSLLTSTREDVEPETEVTGSGNGVAATQAAPTAAAQSLPPAYIPTSVSFSSNVDQATRAKIEEIAARADQVSYTKFTDQKKNMLRVFPNDENAAYKAALAASGPVSEVIRGIDVILKDLGKFEMDFKSAVPARIAAKLGERQDRVASMDHDISDRKKRLTELQAEITQISADMTKLVQAQEAEKSAMALDEKIVRDDESRVMNAVTAVKSVYQSERQKIEEHGRRLQ